MCTDLESGTTTVCIVAMDTFVTPMHTFSIRLMVSPTTIRMLLFTQLSPRVTIRCLNVDVTTSVFSLKIYIVSSQSHCLVRIPVYDCMLMSYLYNHGNAFLTCFIYCRKSLIYIYLFCVRHCRQCRFISQ